MKSKLTIIETPAKPISLPCLMECNTGEEYFTVLRDAWHSGMVIYHAAKSPYKTGFYSFEWDWDGFQPASAGVSITLSND